MSSLARQTGRTRWMLRLSCMLSLLGACVSQDAGLDLSVSYRLDRSAESLRSFSQASLRLVQVELEPCADAETSLALRLLQATLLPGRAHAHHVGFAQGLSAPLEVSLVEDMRAAVKLRALPGRYCGVALVIAPSEDGATPAALLRRDGDAEAMALRSAKRLWVDLPEALTLDGASGAQQLVLSSRDFGEALDADPQRLMSAFLDSIQIQIEKVQ